MIKTLKHIASIQTGIFVKTVSAGEIVFLQSKHFNDSGLINSIILPELKADTITKKHLLKQGDVLFAAKGKKNFAAVFQSQDKPCVASTSFFVIRLQENNIMPEYLAWFINHPSIQSILKGRAIGTAIVSISKTVLEELEISIPNLQTQKAILTITQLRNREITLQRRIEALREQQIQQQISNAIQS